jgi:anti-sigma regulatory factor (Ser/Thr protein kinase)
MSPPHLRHEALIYDSDWDLVERMAPFLRAGLEEGSATLAVLRRGSWALFREALGADAERIRFIDNGDMYVRPARTIAAYDQTLGGLVRDGAPSVRAVAEVEFGPEPSEWQRWIAYESMFNRALADHPARVVCVYNTQVMPDDVIETAWQTHPEVAAGELAASPHYREPEDVVAGIVPAPRAVDGLRDLAPCDSPEAFRQELTAELAASGLPEAAVLNMLVAANEVAENAWRYAGGPQALRVGYVDGGFVCEIADHGPGIDNAMAGFLPPRAAPGRGAGLWIARQLVTQVDVITTDAGATVRLWL